jgi:Ca2+-binding EF-hand superfamily protein
MSSALAMSAALAMSSAPALAQPSPDKLLERLMEADAGHDGVVTRAEFRAWRAGQFGRFDRNGDGYIGRDDLPPFLASRWDGDRMVEMRNRFDTDHDGRISRKEFVDGPMIAYDMADADHDGRVTKAEAEAAMARFEATRK